MIRVKSGAVRPAGHAVRLSSAPGDPLQYALLYPSRLLGGPLPPRRRPEQAVELPCKIVGECRVTAELAAALRIVAGWRPNIMPEDRR